MNETTKKHSDLIRELIVRALIDHPNELKIELRESAGSPVVFWTIQSHADDYRKICGSRGGHIKALTFIAEELGASIGLHYRVWLKEATVGEVRPMRIVDPLDEYDPRPAADLMTRILRACLGPKGKFTVETHSDGTRVDTPPFAIIFTFIIKPEDTATAEELEEFYEDDKDERTIAGSLAVLWKAYGAKTGVSFAVKVEAPK